MKYIIERNDEDELMHYGVKGMKWKIRKKVRKVENTIKDTEIYKESQKRLHSSVTGKIAKRPLEETSSEINNGIENVKTPGNTMGAVTTESISKSISKILGMNEFLLNSSETKINMIKGRNALKNVFKNH